MYMYIYETTEWECKRGQPYGEQHSSSSYTTNNNETTLKTNIDPDSMLPDMQEKETESAQPKEVHTYCS